MACPKCGSCGNGSFEIRENEPRGSAFKYMFVQCTSCGVVVGVLDYFNTGALLHKVMEKLGIRDD